MKQKSAFRQLVANATRLTKILWQHQRGVSIALGIIVVLFSFMPFAQSGAEALLVNELIRSAGHDTITTHLVWLIILLIVVAVIPAFLSACQVYIGKIFWFFLERHLDLMITRRKGEIDIAAHEDPAQNDLFAKVQENGVWRVQNFVDRQFFLIQNIIEVILASVVILYSQWWVFLILLIGTLPELLTEVKYADQVWGMYGARAEVRRRYWDLAGHFDNLAQLTELKLLQNVGRFVKTLSGLFASFHDEQLGKERSKFRNNLMAIGISQLTIGFATVWFILAVVRGEMQVGTLLFVFGSIANLRQSLSGLFMNVGRQYQDSLFVTDVFTLIDIPPTVDRPAKGVKVDGKQAPEIVFDNVTFAYPGVANAVLKNFSLTINPGEKVALIGVNGAGKTTLVKLLCRFYDPTEGRILVNGHDLRELDLESWYKGLGILFQEYANYHLPVEEAIALGKSDKPLSLPRVKSAAEAAEASSFIEAWEQQYQQMLGKKFTDGVEPSIGQWQKLALARLFYRDPNIWILDEPTSAVDAEAESKIFRKLEALPNSRTVILISHRFSTVRQANKIVVIKDGRIEEAGTHHDLMTNNKTYARLFKLQAKGYQA